MNQPIDRAALIEAGWTPPEPPDYEPYRSALAAFYQAKGCTYIAQSIRDGGDLNSYKEDIRGLISAAAVLPPDEQKFIGADG